MSSNLRNKDKLLKLMFLMKCFSRNISILKNECHYTIISHHVTSLQWDVKNNKQGYILMRKFPEQLPHICHCGLLYIEKRKKKKSLIEQFQLHRQNVCKHKGWEVIARERNSDTRKRSEIHLLPKSIGHFSVMLLNNAFPWLLQDTPLPPASFHLPLCLHHHYPVSWANLGFFCACDGLALSFSKLSVLWRKPLKGIPPKWWAQWISLNCHWFN